MAKKKFKFKLEALLRLRKMKEDRLLGDLAGVMQRVNVHTLSRSAAHKAELQELHEFEESYDNRFKMENFLDHNRYLRRLSQEQSEASGKIGELQPELDEARSKLTAAARDRRVVENLKERQQSRYFEELNKSERKELEELNRVRFGPGLTIKKEKKDVKEREFLESLDEYLEHKAEHGVEEPGLDEVGRYLKKHGIPDPRRKRKDNS